MKEVIDLTNNSQDYEFQLRSLNPKKRGLDAYFDFSPITCKKTFRPLSIVPAYHAHALIPFKTELEPQNPFLKVEAPQIQKSGQLFVVKPNVHFCQICKENFEDYLRHTSNPLHRKRIKQVSSQVNYNLLIDIMKKRKTKKSAAPQNTTIGSTQNLTRKRSRNYEEISRQQGRQSSGSKKRIIENANGEIQANSQLFQQEQRQMRAGADPEQQQE